MIDLANTIVEIAKKHPEERFFWIAYYSDGSIFPQFDFDTYSENLFKDIDLNKLRAFSWFPLFPDLDSEFKILLDSNKKLIAFKTCSKTYSANSDMKIIQQGDKKVIAYVLGWQEIGNNENKVLTYITEKQVIISSKTLEV